MLAKRKKDENDKCLIKRLASAKSLVKNMDFFTVKSFSSRNPNGTPKKAKNHRNLPNFAGVGIFFLLVLQEIKKKLHLHSLLNHWAARAFPLQRHMERGRKGKPAEKLWKIVGSCGRFQGESDRPAGSVSSKWCGLGPDGCTPVFRRPANWLLCVRLLVNQVYQYSPSIHISLCAILPNDVATLSRFLNAVPSRSILTLCVAHHPVVSHPCNTCPMPSGLLWA